VSLEQFRLDGKSALVTGAATGIGAAIAVALAEAGADVACHANRSEPDEVLARIEALGRSAIRVRGDLARQGAAKQVFDTALDGLGSIDILINNAGTIRRAPAVSYAEQDWTEIVETNLSSVFRLSQCAGRWMMENRRPGKIVNIASLLSFQGGVTVPAYAAAKGGVVQLTKALANEWAAQRINVNAIAPGYIRTASTQALREDENRNRQILERIPAGRWGEPQDITGAAVFLCSPASDYVNGHVLVVDGGWMGR
jgi:2-deoxy-D-gluconate 3-dehydrogenase